MRDGEGHAQLHGERLLIGAIRRLVRRGDCTAASAAFERACGWAGPDACRTLKVFVQQLALHGKRRLTLALPFDPVLTRDERTILCVFGCAQLGAYAGMDAALADLLDATPPATLGAAACVVAELLAIHGCIVEAAVDDEQVNGRSFASTEVRVAAGV
jgi:hypothetical protein